MVRIPIKSTAAACAAVLCFCMFACSSKEPQAASAEVSYAPVNQLLGAAALAGELRSRNAALKAHLLPYAHTLPEVDRAPFRTLIGNAFADDKLYRALCGFLNSQVPGDSLEMIAAALRDKNNRAMRARLAKALDPAAAEVRKNFNRDVATDSAMMEQYRLIEGGAGAAGARILTDATRPTMEILNDLQPDSLRMRPDDIRTGLDSMYARLDNFLTGEALQAIAFAYGTMDRDAVTKFVDFYRAPLGRWYEQRLKDAFHAVFDAAVADYRDALIKFAAGEEARVSGGRMLAYTQAGAQPELLIGLANATVNGRDETAFVNSVRNEAGNLYLSLEFVGMTPELRLDIQTQFNGEGMYPISKNQSQIVINMEGLPEPFIVNLDAKSSNELWVHNYKSDVGLCTISFHLDFGGGEQGRAFTFDCNDMLVSSVN